MESNMRERTTWTRSAAQMKVADPYLMNQDHVSQQPGADDYVIGDSSTFAEDVHPSKDTWEAEYAGGQVKRNEIGMPEMRKDTFNHAEKTAADHAFLLKKADLCIKTASLMLVNASESAIEDQATALMHLPDADLIHTFNRLAGEGEGHMAQQQVQAQKMQAQQCLAQGDVQGAQQCMAQMVQTAQECMKANDFEAAQSCMAEAQEIKKAIEAAAQQGQAPVAGGMWAGKLAQDQEQDEQGQQAQGQQQAKGQQGQQKKQAQQVQAEQIQAAVQQAVAQAVQQVMAQMGQQAQQAPMQQQAQMGQQAQMQQQAQDEQLLADMLMEPGLDDMSEMGIEMEAAPMDVGEAGLAPEDDVLMTLFASDDQGQQAQDEQGQEQAQQQGQQKQAMSRTASTRTVGTRPTQGVSRVGGSMGKGGSDVNKLAALWPSAPDVSDAFR